MEKIIRNLSAVITSLLIYAVGAYAYLSFKGFEYQNGSFSLVQNARAFSLNENNGNNQLAVPLDSNLSLNLGSAQTTGDAKAPLTLYEFSSLGCTHCADFHLNILPELEKDFIKTGKLKIVFVNFPLEKKSMMAALLSECVPAQNRPNFLNTVFAKQRSWMLSRKPQKTLTELAAANGLTRTAAEECLDNEKLADEIIANRQEGIEKLKMQGTPAFLIAGNGKNEIIYGVPDYESLKAYLNERLAPQ